MIGITPEGGLPWGRQEVADLSLVLNYRKLHVQNPVRLGLLAATLLGIRLGAPARADEPKVTTREDVVYTKAGDTELKLDVVAPEGDGPFPGILVIHGGAWRAGNKRDVRAAMIEYARAGYVAVSPQYRFCPKEVFPAQVHDVKAAVRWMRANAGSLHLDHARIGASGYSAGGHLALMLGLTDPKDGLEGDGVPPDAPSTRVQAVVNFFGPTDLGANDIPDVSKPLVSGFLGGSAEQKPEACRKASPLTFVTKDDPPTLTFQGTKDPLVPHSQAIKLAEAQSSAGVAGRVELMVGSGHGWGGADLKHTTEEAIAFFDRHLKPTGTR